MTPGRSRADALDAFEAELLSGGIVTHVLERWSGGRVHADVDRAAVAPASESVRLLLGVEPGEPMGYRRVRLMCGDTVLSRADNWFVPARLSDAINAALDRDDTPFGALIAPLSPSRRTLSAERLGGDDLLRITAVVVDARGWPIAQVAETYSAAILA